VLDSPNVFAVPDITITISTIDGWRKTVRDWHLGACPLFRLRLRSFYRYCELGEHTPSTKLLVIKNGELRERKAEYEEQNYVRDKFRDPISDAPAFDIGRQHATASEADQGHRLEFLLFAILE
jgi:hypothetical protein